MGNKNVAPHAIKLLADKPHRKKLNRRHFLLGMVAISATAIIPPIISCSPIPIHDIHKQLTDKDFNTLIAVQNHLFPTSKDSPGAKDVHAGQYFTWVLTDPDKDPDSIEQMRNGIRWTHETAMETYKEEFIDLNFEEKENVLQIMSNEGWGENWLSVVLTLIFEALLSDPIYGSNTNESGWKWLDHTTGIPRPTKDNTYHPIA
jgi:hypothetical protein